MAIRHSSRLQRYPRSVLHSSANGIAQKGLIVNRNKWFVLAFGLGVLLGSPASRADVLFDFNEFHSGLIYPALAGPVSDSLWMRGYTASPDLPQLPNSLSAAFFLDVEGIIDTILPLPPDPDSYYVIAGLEDPRYGQSNYHGTWRLHGEGFEFETGTFSLVMTYRPEYVAMIDIELMTVVSGTFTADPGALAVPGYGLADWSSVNPMIFTGGSDQWGGLMGTLTGYSPSPGIVPEPASFCLIGMGLAGRFARRRAR